MQYWKQTIVLELGRKSIAIVGPKGFPGLLVGDLIDGSSQQISVYQERAVHFGKHTTAVAGPATILLFDRQVEVALCSLGIAAFSESV